MAQLCQESKKFQELKTRVVIISFGSFPAAKIWVEETCSDFMFLLDPERETYQTYGLGRSLLRSWGPKTIWRYIQLLLAGRKWKGIQGDSTQLGGDFLIDQNGRIQLAYRSSDPTDRPTPKHILNIIETLHH